MLPRAARLARAPPRAQLATKLRAYSSDLYPRTREEILQLQIQRGQIPAEARPHPSAIQDPRLNQKGRPSNGPFMAILLGSVIAVPPLIYFYWQYREEHMKAKKEQLLAEVRARYQAGL